jgi:hypothetical protein
MPPEFAQLLQVRSVLLKGARDKRVVHVPVKGAGRTSFAEVAFPAKARIGMRLLVDIPKELRQHEFEIAVRQLYQKREVGRVTWRLVPPRKQQR